jgi:hypothetical protein
MSHQNPYISRDVDINAYVLQKDTAMSPYIVHVKTDVSLKSLVPKSIRSKDFQKGMDVNNRAKRIKEFEKKLTSY